MKEVLEFLDSKNVKYELREHEEVHTMEDMENLGLLDQEEVMLLEHMLISHHGQPTYGACKKPETPEALLLWIIDTIDSKLRVVEEKFIDVEPGTFSDAIGVLERMKFYKKK